jgi:hypothetical protein
MINIIGWILVFIGGIIGVIPTMAYQVWNGASLFGVVIVSLGGYFVLKGLNENV